MLEMVGARNKVMALSNQLEQAGKLGRYEKSLILKAYLTIEKANSIIKILEEKTKEGV